MITLSADLLAGRQEWEGSLPLLFRSMDDGDAYSTLGVKPATITVPGQIYVGRRWFDCTPAELARPQDVVLVMAQWPPPAPGPNPHSGDPVTQWIISGNLRRGSQWEAAPVALVALREELYSPIAGLLESAVLAGKCVLVVGLGSGGAPIVLEFAKMGVDLILVDHDRLEVHNLERHVGGLSEVGRRKTNVVSELVREKNPYANVAAYDFKLDASTREQARSLIRRSDLVIGALDNNEGRLILNRLCCEEDKPLIIAGAFRRAYGGQVLVIRPHQTPCYQCFVKLMPEKVREQEISSAEQARRYAYSDRPVAIEPGLSVDIAPISLMVAKLGLQLLLQGRATTLRSLDEDLTAPWYLWLNRREPQTDYEKLDPLGCEVNGFHILRWYGIDYPRDPACPCCGDFNRNVAAAEGIQLGPADIAGFADSGVKT